MGVVNFGYPNFLLIRMPTIWSVQKSSDNRGLFLYKVYLPEAASIFQTWKATYSCKYVNTATIRFAIRVHVAKKMDPSKTVSPGPKYFKVFGPSSPNTWDQYWSIWNTSKIRGPLGAQILHSIWIPQSIKIFGHLALDSTLCNIDSKSKLVTVHDAVNNSLYTF